MTYLNIPLFNEVQISSIFSRFSSLFCSKEMMTNYSNPSIYSKTMNIFSSILELITLTISFILLCFIIFRLLRNKYHQYQFKLHIPIILSINSLSLYIIKSLLQFLNVNFNTLKRDFHFKIQEIDSFTCRLHGYIFSSVVSAVYWSYTLQALFHFTRVLYPRWFWLHQSKTYLCILIPGEILLAFAGVLPLLLTFDSIHLISDEVYCTISIEKYISLIYFFLIIFGLPFGIILIFYIYLICRMRRQPLRRTVRRDYIVIRRIMLIISLIGLTSIPIIIDLMLSVVNNQFGLTIYRMQWIVCSVYGFIISISLPYVNPHIYLLLQKERKYEPYRIKYHAVRKTISFE